MTVLHRILGRALAGAGLLACLATPAHAAGFPDRPISIIVPYTPGGSSDVVARLLGQQLAVELKQSVVVENKPGAGATLGTSLVAKAAPDGYTVLLADNAQTTAPSLYPRLPYDAVKSFTALGMVGIAPAMLLSNQPSGLRSVKDMRDDVERNRRGYTIGVGSGSPSHLISAFFQRRSELNLMMVPYKGASQAATDVLGGQIDLIFTNPASAAQYLQSGRMNAIGMTGTERLPSLPNVATFQEQGVKGLENVKYWFAVLAPAGLPADVSDKWHAALAATLAHPEVKRRLAELGITQVAMTPEQLQGFIAEDRETWANVVKENGMQLQ
ncbi:tripartite tricarboxylate transporter substrate binding protein [Achromobacter denitrificans]|nr:tripartite tricarboxylate transporter substrate binding protein [Achromobacter denitrificans]